MIHHLHRDVRRHAPPTLRQLLSGAVLVLAVAVACGGDATAPAPQVLSYRLVSFNDHPIPYRQDLNAVDAGEYANVFLSGTLTLSPDGSFARLTPTRTIDRGVASEIILRDFGTYVPHGDTITFSYRGMESRGVWTEGKQRMKFDDGYLWRYERE